MYRKTGYKLCKREEEEGAVATTTTATAKISNDKISRPYGLCHFTHIVFVRSNVGWNRISRDPIEPGRSKMLGLIRKLKAVHTHIQLIYVV